MSSKFVQYFIQYLNVILTKEFIEKKLGVYTFCRQNKFMQIKYVYCRRLYWEWRENHRCMLLYRCLYRLRLPHRRCFRCRPCPRRLYIIHFTWERNLISIFHRRKYIFHTFTVSQLSLYVLECVYLVPGKWETAWNTWGEIHFLHCRRQNKSEENFWFQFQ